MSTEAIWGDSIFLTGGYFMIYFFVQVPNPNLYDIRQFWVVGTGWNSERHWQPLASRAQFSLSSDPLASAQPSAFTMVPCIPSYSASWLGSASTTCLCWSTPGRINLHNLMFLFLNELEER